MCVCVPVVVKALSVCVCVCVCVIIESVVYVKPDCFTQTLLQLCALMELV